MANRQNSRKKKSTKRRQTLKNKKQKKSLRGGKKNNKIQNKKLNMSKRIKWPSDNDDLMSVNRKSQLGGSWGSSRGYTDEIESFW